MAIERRKSSKKKVLKEGEYERANGTFEYRWRDGRSKRHSVYAKTLEELREKEKEVQRDILDGIQIESRELRVNDVYQVWKQVKRGLKNNTFQNYCYMYEMYVEPDFGLTRLCNLKKSDVRAFYNRLHDGRGLKTATIDNVHTVLHQVLNLAVEDGYLRFNPSDSALTELRKAHNLESPHKRALTVDEQTIFEEFLKRQGQFNKWYPIFIVMLWTGLRSGEVAGLRWCDVDLEEDFIDVNHTLVYFDDHAHGQFRWAVNPPKTQAGNRRVPMLPIVKLALLMEKKLQEEFEVDRSFSVDGYTDFIFLNRFGLPYYHGALNKALKRIIRDCNYEILEQQEKDGKPVVLLPNFTNHSLRHTFTTRMCESGINIKSLQVILGHSDAKITMDVYADATQEFNDSEMRKAADFMYSQYGLRV